MVQSQQVLYEQCQRRIGFLFLVLVKLKESTKRGLRKEASLIEELGELCRQQRGRVDVLPVDDDLTFIRYRKPRDLKTDLSTPIGSVFVRKVVDIVGVHALQRRHGTREGKFNRGEQARLPSAIWAVDQDHGGVQRDRDRSADTTKVFYGKRLQPKTHTVSVGSPLTVLKGSASSRWRTSRAASSLMRAEASNCSAIGSRSGWPSRSIWLIAMPASFGSGRVSGSNTESQSLRFAVSLAVPTGRTLLTRNIPSIVALEGRRPTTTVVKGRRDRNRSNTRARPSIFCSIRSSFSTVPSTTTMRSWDSPVPTKRAGNVNSIPPMVTGTGIRL
ncbi:hypothetical protein ACPOL_4691 [Acidisarcina polymorpha]|uniref:Uncharacterized protein n=1 Tax=Acidisarcina polymorpha TaxID=2211140 RepID=A0A2Z5G4G2_9BACT|nr:hypothetical protein ACPOL_4691 [Acidisarcina polymorpha]